MNVCLNGEIWIATPIQGGVRLTLTTPPYRGRKVWFDLMIHNPVTITPWARPR